MGSYLERIASGRLGTANGGGVFSQLYNYDLVVCYTRDDEIYIATKNTKSHQIGGTTGMYAYSLPGEENFSWIETKVFDHSTPTGGDPTATVVAPPVLWVARSGKYLPGVSPNTPACTRNILHLAWAVKYTSGANQDKYQVFHCMRDKDSVWTCAAGTIASLNAITNPSATTGQWLNVQMIGLRKWDSSNSRFMSYGTNPTDAETTLYLTYFGRESNAGSTPNDIFLTTFGAAGDNYRGNDWDATQTWLAYANRINTSNTAYADDLFQQYTLSKASRTTAPIEGPPTVYSHTAQTGTTGHFISIGYTRKGLSKSGGTRTGYYPVYRKYHPDTGVLDAETDPTLGVTASLPNGRDTALVSTPEQIAYLYDSLILFRPTGGGSSGISDSKYYDSHLCPLVTGHLNYYDTNRSRALKDGDGAESSFRTFMSFYFRLLRKNVDSGSGGSGTEYAAQYTFTAWPMEWPIQHASCGVSENYSFSYAATLTPPVYQYQLRTGVSAQVKGYDAFIAVISMKYPSYTGVTNYSDTSVPPARWTGTGAYVPNNYYHSRHYGTRLRFTRRQIFAISDNQYMLSSGSNAILATYALTWPQMGDFDCINPCVFRAPWFQDGSMPYNMANDYASVFEAYQTDGVDNSIWLVKRGGQPESFDNESPWGFYENTGYYTAEGQQQAVEGSIEAERTANVHAYNGFSSFAGETRRSMVRSSIRQDESIYNRIARPVYALTFNYDVFNSAGFIVDRWNQSSEPQILHGISQYEATTPIFIGFSVRNQASSAARTANISGFAKFGTVTLSAGSIGETHWNARGKAYTSSLLIDTADGAVAYIWIKLTPPGGQPYPPTPQAIDLYLTFAQAT